MVTYVEHTACKVKDLDWCVEFFTEVFDIPTRLSLGEKPNHRIWLHAGTQLNEDIAFDEKEGRLDRIALVTTDCDNVHEKRLAWGCTVPPTGGDWLKVPNGIVIELRRGNNEVLRTVISQEP